MFYKTILFLHITGALLLSATIAIEWVCFIDLRHANSLEMIRHSVINYSKLNKIGSVAMFLILVPGIYMTIAVWKGTGWIIVSLTGIVLLGAIGGILTGKKMHQIKLRMDEDAHISEQLKQLLLYNSFWLSIKTRTTIFLGIVLLMTLKPALTASIVTFAVSIFAGFIPIQKKNYSTIQKMEVQDMN